MNEQITSSIGPKLQVTGLVGFTGLATSGKDLLCAKIKERGSVNRMALADNLKSDVRGFLIDKFSIDIMNCSPAEKELIRPLLVAYGKVKRIQTKGTYWTSKIEHEARNKKTSSVVVVTDVRYCDTKYADDEVYWLKRLGGVLVHISRYEIKNGKKNFVVPPNDDEAYFDPILSAIADYHVEWPTCKDDPDMLNSYVDSLVEWLNGNLRNQR